jgi:hypothetical protein
MLVALSETTCYRGIEERQEMVKPSVRQGKVIQFTNELFELEDVKLLAVEVPV